MAAFIRQRHTATAFHASSSAADRNAKNRRDVPEERPRARRRPSRHEQARAVEVREKATDTVVERLHVAAYTGSNAARTLGRLTTGRRREHHQIECKFGEGLDMLNLANDIRSLSDFKRNTTELLDRIRKTGNPLVLTINGRAEVVVQDAEAYQHLLDRLETVEALQRGLADVKAGRTKPARELFDRMRRKHGIPR